MNFKDCVSVECFITLSSPWVSFLFEVTCGYSVKVRWFCVLTALQCWVCIHVNLCTIGSLDILWCWCFITGYYLDQVLSRICNMLMSELYKCSFVSYMQCVYNKNQLLINCLLILRCSLMGKIGWMLNAKLKKIRLSYHQLSKKSFVYCKWKTIHSSALLCFIYLIFNIYFLHMYVCIYICVYMYSCRFIQRLEVNAECLFLLFSTVFLEVKSLSEIWAYCLDRWVSHQAQGLPVSVSDP